MYRFLAIPALLLGLLAPRLAAAHFQELIPSLAIVDQNTARSVQLDLAFTHPMARVPAMEMPRPVRFGVLVGGRHQDLSASLVETQARGRRAYRAEFRLRQPGDHIFYVEPGPYWEAAEATQIVHYTKVVVDGYGAGDAWDARVGFPVEIEPLTRPYGLWTGNLFRGRVLRGGEPAAFVRVEVEWRNDGSLKAPADAFITQIIKTDAQGVFAYAMPRAGWWGFAALFEADTPVPAPDGREVPLEQGAVIWVQTRDMQ